MRRRPGLHGIAVRAREADAFHALAEETQAKRLETLRTQMATFRASLEAFAAAHRDDIRRDPAFRQQFHSMCANIGVDPLVSAKGGTWAARLGLGEFYYALAVTVLDVCKARRAFDGGLTELPAVLRHVQRRRGAAADPISADDVARAIDKLEALGGGLGIVTIGGRPFVRSVPAELSTDGNALIDLAHTLGGFFARADVAANLGWSDARTSDALTALAKDGLILVDDPPGSGTSTGAATAAMRLYWCPAVGMEAAVEEFQRREGLPVTGFGGADLTTLESAALSTG